jgi:hypothetical protein
MTQGSSPRTTMARPGPWAVRAALLLASLGLAACGTSAPTSHGGPARLIVLVGNTGGIDGQVLRRPAIVPRSGSTASAAPVANALVEVGTTAARSCARPSLMATASSTSSYRRALTA